MKIKPKKLKLAIFDLTDCEGCELEFLTLRKELAGLGHDFEIENWRLASSVQNPGPFDVTFIEGSPISEADIEILKQARRVSEKVVALGTCAVFGGIQAMISDAKRAALAQRKSRAPKPLSYYIDVDFNLPGCPVSQKELKRLVLSLFAGKKFASPYYPVCLECKIEQNNCLFLEEGFCLGPVSLGGCGAPCPKAGLACKGCNGPLPKANFETLRKNSNLSDKELELALSLFFKETNEYKDFKTKKTSKTKITEKK